MMEDLTCTICFLDYDTENNVPKVLPCGHTICMVCLQRVLQSESKCPVCRRNLNEFCASMYANNFTLINLIESGVLNNVNDLSSTIEPLVSKATGTLEVLVKELNEKQAELNEKQAAVERIKKSVEILQRRSSAALPDSKDYLSSVWQRWSSVEAPRKAQNVILKEVENLKRELNCISGIERNSKNVILQLKDFHTNEEYLQEIEERLRQNEELYVANEVNGIAKYGKISRDNNKILVHCMDQAQTPAPQCTLLKFDDLKHLMPLGFSEAFMVIMYQKEKLITAMIDIENSNKGRAFVKHCTGELATSYKGCCYYEGFNSFDSGFKSAFKVPKSTFTNSNSSSSRLTKQQITSELNLSVKLNAGETVIIGLDNGDFEIRYNSTYKFVKNSEIIGILRKPRDLLDIVDYGVGNHRKIIDCGVVLNRGGPIVSVSVFWPIVSVSVLFLSVGIGKGKIWPLLRYFSNYLVNYF